MCWPYALFIVGALEIQGSDAPHLPFPYSIFIGRAQIRKCERILRVFRQAWPWKFSEPRPKVIPDVLIEAATADVPTEAKTMLQSSAHSAGFELVLLLSRVEMKPRKSHQQETTLCCFCLLASKGCRGPTPWLASFHLSLSLSLPLPPPSLPPSVSLYLSLSRSVSVYLCRSPCSRHI